MTRSASSSPLPPFLARIHSWARGHPGLARFTLVNRLLLAMAFLPTGMVKVLGQRFTLLPLEHPVGFFFEAMFRTGPYWHFIGGVQVLAALLLLVPATATLGALLFLPVGLSILLITWGVGFQGTVHVAVGMLLAVAYLLFWDLDRLWTAAATLLGGGEVAGPPGTAPLWGRSRMERAGWIGFAVGGMGLMLAVRNLLPSDGALIWVGVAGVGAGLVITGWWRARARVRRESASGPIHGGAPREG